MKEDLAYYYGFYTIFAKITQSKGSKITFIIKWDKMIKKKDKKRQPLNSQRCGWSSVFVAHSL